MVKVDYPQGIKNSSSDFFAGNSDHPEHNRHILEHLFVEKKAKILEDTTDSPSQFINFVVVNSDNILPINDDLTLSRKDLSQYNFKEGGFSGTTGSSDKVEVSSLYVECNIRERPPGRLVLLPDVI